MTADEQRLAELECESSLSPEDIERVQSIQIQSQAAVFSALANDTRYKILRLILSADSRVCGCELEQYLEVGQSSISQSLSHLHEAGLLSRTKEGRWRYYEPTELAEALVEPFDEQSQDMRLSV